MGSTMKTWFWLEDLPNTVTDLDAAMVRIARKHGAIIERFEAIPTLQERLLQLSHDTADALREAILILDVMLGGHLFVDCPQEWGEQAPERYRTNNGYDAGLVFYERLVLDHPLEPWKGQPPPVVFLTAREFQQAQEQDLERLRTKWAEAWKVKVDSAKVRWITKEATTDTARKLEEALMDFDHEAID